MARAASTILLALAAGLGLTDAGQAQTPQPPEGLRWIALRDINEAWGDDREPTNRPAVVWTVPEGMIRPVDVNRDGVVDWLMDYSRDASHSFCGSGGCQQRLYVSRNGEHVAVFDRQALELTVLERDGETVVEAGLHHLNCAPRAPDCRFAWAWDEAQGRLVQRIPSTGETRLIDGGPPPLEFEPDDANSLPLALSQQWYGGRLTCPSQADDGFDVLRPGIVSIPDVTGDGRPDWMLTPPPPCDMDAPLRGFSIWADDGAGDAREVHVSILGVVGLIDMATTPATVIEQQGCGYDPECVETRLRWDAGAGRFVPAR